MLAHAEFAGSTQLHRVHELSSSSVLACGIAKAPKCALHLLPEPNLGVMPAPAHVGPHQAGDTVHLVKLVPSMPSRALFARRRPNAALEVVEEESHVKAADAMEALEERFRDRLVKHASVGEGGAVTKQRRSERSAISCRIIGDSRQHQGMQGVAHQCSSNVRTAQHPTHA